MKKLLLPVVVLALLSCKEPQKSDTNQLLKKSLLVQKPLSFEEKIARAALSIIDPEVVYTPNYVVIGYPNGDVPPKTGVCTDVIIRTYRQLGIDLQKELHEDIKAHFSAYPNLKKWGLKKPDTNIDHRRVPNLEVFFTRKGQKLAISSDPNHYKTGEIVTWLINGKLPHIGIVTHLKSADGARPLIVHNIGNGQIMEDCLFNYPIVGHFKYVK